MWIATIVVVLLVAAAGGWAWLGRQAPTTVRTTVARERGATQQATVLNASGYVTARRRATVAAEVTGRLTDVRVEEGMPVERGQVLARLDDSQQRARLTLAESQLAEVRSAEQETRVRLKLARLTLARAERLAREGVSDEAAHDAARSEVEALLARLDNQRKQVEVAEREVALRQTELDDTVIRAPFDGIVISKDAQPGEMVSPVSAGGSFVRSGICTIVDMSSLEIEVDVNESYISRVRPDQPVEAVLDAYPDWRIPAHVITTVPAADRQRATVLVRIAFEALDPRLLPDMGVKVAFRESDGPPAEGVRSAVVVPLEAVRAADGRDVVFIVDGDRVERRAVRLGARAEAEVEIVAGLSGGERVVVEASAELNDGDRVDVE